MYYGYAIFIFESIIFNMYFLQSSDIFLTSQFSSLLSIYLSIYLSN